jgi:predicted DNA-binding transcriptional regulator AlpA
MPHHLVGTAEIAGMLSVSRQYVDRLSREDSAFPKPEVSLASGRVWKREAVEKWAKATGREIVKGA